MQTHKEKINTHRATMDFLQWTKLPIPIRGKRCCDSKLDSHSSRSEMTRPSKAPLKSKLHIYVWNFFTHETPNAAQKERCDTFRVTLVVLITSTQTRGGKQSRK